MTGICCKIRIGTPDATRIVWQLCCLWCILCDSSIVGAVYCVTAVLLVLYIVWQQCCWCCILCDSSVVVAVYCVTEVLLVLYIVWWQCCWCCIFKGH